MSLKCPNNGQVPRHICTCTDCEKWRKAPLPPTVAPPPPPMPADPDRIARVREMQTALRDKLHTAEGVVNSAEHSVEMARRKLKRAEGDRDFLQSEYDAFIARYPNEVLPE